MELNFEKGNGLIPAIVQEYRSGDILMLAYINDEAWKKTLETGIAHYWSRGREKIWKKGESSGNIQEVKEIRIDCDNDTVIFKVNQVGGAACHLGYKSCFFRKVQDNEVIITESRVFDPSVVYDKDS